MRIAYVCADAGVPVFGAKGCSIHVQEVVRALTGMGDEVVLFAARTGGPAPRDLDRIDTHRLPDVRGAEPHARERAALEANDRLANVLHEKGPFDAVYERYSLWSFAGMEFARSLGIPGLLEVNSPLVQEQEEHRRLHDRTGAEQAARRAFSAASAILAVSEEVAGWVDEVSPAAGRLHVIPNGVRPARFENAPVRWPREEGSFTVGFVGSLKPWHGVSVLAEAFAEVWRREPRSRCLVVGDGPEREPLTSALVRTIPRERVRLTGTVSPDEVPGWLAAMDAAVAPYPSSDRFYFSPLKVYEYMAASLPIVASRAGQLADLLEDGVDALLCPSGDVAALVDALDRLRRNPELARRLGQAAAEKVRRDHTWDAVARRIRSVARDAQTLGMQPAVFGGRR